VEAYNAQYKIPGVNAGISSITYARVDGAVEWILQLGIGTD
jgi:hypothetical protein